jgi:hypothetical protein
MLTNPSEVTQGLPPKDRRRRLLDRRSGDDRRSAYSLDYFLNGGLERRHGEERRRQAERRVDWKRVVKWYSVFYNR